MKIQILALSAAALLSAASVAAAAPSEVQEYARRAQAKAEVMLRKAGVDLGAQSVVVRANVRSDGHLTGLYVVQSSGSRETDHAVETVLHKIVVTDAPLGLVNGAVTLSLRPTAIAEASAP